MKKTYVQTIRIYNQDIGREFGFEKCAEFIIKNEGKRETMEGVELPS